MTRFIARAGELYLYIITNARVCTKFRAGKMSYQNEKKKTFCGVLM
jgi:hypothetical protein